jgi:NADP-dependent 3-hydroxy acid dehydrogenase YdfG
MDHRTAPAELTADRKQTNKTAIVTGGSRSFGKAWSRRSRRRRCGSWLLARDAVHLEKVARAFRGPGAAFILTALDIRAPDVNADEFKKAESWRR